MLIVEAKCHIESSGYRIEVVKVGHGEQADGFQAQGIPALHGEEPQVWLWDSSAEKPARGRLGRAISATITPPPARLSACSEEPDPAEDPIRQTEAHLRFTSCY
ncbi:MAG: hypothetical protein HC897_10535 [Thermoanaerobaculia bacterium]|nr:hypothetical protein [Thermoanaerobaculia bacterium]